MRAYVKLFQELDRCEFIVDYEYKGNIDDYEYNGITYSQSSAFYYDYLNNLYNDFLVEWSSLGEEDRTVAHGMMNLMLSKRFMSDGFFFDVPSIEIVEAMKNDKSVPRDDVKMAMFLYEMSAQQKFFLEQVKNFLNGNHQPNDVQQTFTGENYETAEDYSSSLDINNNTQNLYQLLHEKYGDTMTVKQLCDFFHVSSRTISNWEQKGLVINISETSNEYTAIGHKKRGDEKRYLTSDVATNVELQRKFSRL